MFFEGPEKKVEIGLRAEGPDLRLLERRFWEARVAEAGAVILSEIQNDHVTAYLLSESSLFVFARRVLMITCGRTTLVTATEAMLDAFGEQAEYLVFERKNEHFPEYQRTGFLDDAARIAARLPASAWRFGTPDSHRILLLTSTAPFTPDRRERTLEILMHGIHPEASRLFGPDRAGAPKEQAFRSLFAGFEVDEHFFAPAGYSLNAIRGSDYLTVHVTPEDIASYVSFETNLDFGDDPGPWVDRVRAVFEPRSLDVMTFSATPVTPFELPNHQIVAYNEHPLPCGFHVSFRHLERAPEGPCPAFPLPLG